jgi:excisionase family DNA binding protein
VTGTGPQRHSVPAGGAGLDLSAPKRPPRGPQPTARQSQEGGTPTAVDRHTAIPTPDPGKPAAGRLVDQRHAASLAGCSRDTIVRARRAGRLPHSRLYGQRWLIAVDDLAAAGLLLPEGTDDDTAPEAGAGHGGEGSSAAVELARAEARLGALEDLLARQDDELAFLRQLAADHLRRAS